MSHHDNLKINQQNFENGFDSDNVDWLSIPHERHEINASDLNIIDSPNSFFVLIKTRKVTNNSHSRIVKKNDTKPNTDFATSNCAGRKILDKTHNHCQYHSHSTNTSYDLSPLINLTTHSNSTIANINRDRTKKIRGKKTLPYHQHLILFRLQIINSLLIVNIQKSKRLNLPHKIY